jgi:hypothetical protein
MRALANPARIRGWRLLRPDVFDDGNVIYWLPRRYVDTFIYTPYLPTQHPQHCAGMSDKVECTRAGARATIEQIARRKGTFTHKFRLEAEEEAKNGRPSLLQAMESGQEIREDFSKLSKM